MSTAVLLYRSTTTRRKRVSAYAARSCASVMLSALYSIVTQLAGTPTCSSGYVSPMEVIYVTPLSSSGVYVPFTVSVPPFM